MRIFNVCLMFLCFVLNYSSGLILPRSVEPYYWRDYNGLLPTDAVKGGTDEDGSDTYIGQFSAISECDCAKPKINTFPAVIKVGSKYATAAYARRAIISNDSSNTKILCYNNYVNKFRWSSPIAAQSVGCRVVVGGNEDGQPLYIGRATYNKQLLVGKFSNNMSGLVTPYNDSEIFHSKYEILLNCA